MVFGKDESKSKLESLRRQYDALDNRYQLAAFDEEQARLQERAKKRVYDYIRSNAGPYRKGNGGIKAYDSGDVIDGEGNVLKEGLRAKEFMQREVGDSQAKRAALELQLAEQARRNAWNEMQAMQIEEDKNNRGVGSEREEFRKMYPPPQQQQSRRLMDGEKYDPLTDIMVTDAQGNMVIHRTAPNQEYKAYQEFEKNYLNNKRRESAAKEMGLSFSEMYGSGSGNSAAGSRPKAKLSAGQQFAFNAAAKEIQNKIAALDPSDPMIDTHLDQLDQIENARNNALKAIEYADSKRRSENDPAVKMAGEMQERRDAPSSAGKIDISFVDRNGATDTNLPERLDLGEEDFAGASQRFHEEQVARDNARRAAEAAEMKKKKRVGSEFGPDEIEVSLVDSLESGTATMPPPVVPVPVPAAQ